MGAPREAWIPAMVKHLPPSGALLRLLDINGESGAILSTLRPDIQIERVRADFSEQDIAADSVDAVTLFAQPLTPRLLTAALHALRPGGRLIALLPDGQVDSSWVAVLEQHGYIRILVEPAHEMAAGGVLARGEKPHVTSDTLERIRVASARDDLWTDLSHYPGRSLYLLVHQSPNKPVWALREGEALRWEAVAIDASGQPTFLAFSSLAKAVAFMQPAVLHGHLRDINKVAKYSVVTIKSWPTQVTLNPPTGFLADRTHQLMQIDVAQAEAQDE